MTERKKPPPMWAVWNETHGIIESTPTRDRAEAETRLARRRLAFPNDELRLIKLVPQPEPPQ